MAISDEIKSIDRVAETLKENQINYFQQMDLQKVYWLEIMQKAGFQNIKPENITIRRKQWDYSVASGKQ